MSQAFDPELATRIETFGVIAVLVVDRADDAIPPAKALLDGGVGVMELTLRTPAALDALKKIRASVPEMIAGVNEKNMATYLGEPIVGALGGSWLAPRELINAADWPAITARCAAAAGIIASTRKSS
ncbi:MAG: hypothetical protein NTV93_14490 [Verrucomicrobia bacterium]|nr:hypothetical protein [Verrucomicrobiota bacterium]